MTLVETTQASLRNLYLRAYVEDIQRKREEELPWKTLTNIRGVAFDMDGVVADTEGEMYRAMGVINGAYHIGKERYKTLTVHDDLRYRGMGKEAMKDFVTRTLGITEADEACIEFWRQKRNVIYERRMMKKSRVFPGVFPFLKTLSELDLPVALATSAQRHEKDIVFQSVGFRDGDADRTFAHVVTRDDVPAAENKVPIYLRAAELLKVPPDACLAVEDSLPGVESASEAGFLVIAVPCEVMWNDPLYIKKIQKKSLMVVKNLYTVEALIRTAKTEGTPESFSGIYKNGTRDGYQRNLYALYQ